MKITGSGGKRRRRDQALSRAARGTTSAIASGGGAVIEAEEAAEAIAPAHRARAVVRGGIRVDQRAAETLVRTLVVVVADVLGESAAEVALAEGHHAGEELLASRAHPALAVRVRMHRQLHRIRRIRCNRSR